MAEFTGAAAAKEIYYAGLKAVDPYRCVAAWTDTIKGYLRAKRTPPCERVVSVAFGKAAYSMTAAVADSLKNIALSGIVLTKYGYSGHHGLPDSIDVYEGGHPVPDKNGMEATKRILEILADADDRTLVVCLISGGASALLVAPLNDISLSDKQGVTELLLKSGASIQEINTVRKHISAAKGGRLAEIAHPARLISFVLSDVIGDRLDVIGSGPTVPDESLYSDAVEVLDKYDLLKKIPPSVAKVLKEGLAGRLPETPKPESSLFQRSETIIVGNNGKATSAARMRAVELGYEATVTSSAVEGEAVAVGLDLARRALSLKRVAQFGRKRLCFISGGETTVTVRGDGKGGRNTELALAFAIEVAGVEGITLLSAGTDGTDGPTDAAGAVVDGKTLTGPTNWGVDPVKYLKNNDSYTFFKAVGGLFMTGPTGTNVMDLQVLLIEP